MVEFVFSVYQVLGSTQYLSAHIKKEERAFFFKKEFKVIYKAWRDSSVLRALAGLQRT